MGLGQSSNKIYLSVADGKIIQRVQEGTKGAIQRTTITNKVIHELKYSFIEGFISGISIKENEYGKDWVFEIEDENGSYSLQMMYNSRYATTLLNCLCNPEIDFNLPVTITPWCKEVDGKKKTSCYVKNGGNDIKWYFTKENPNGMPELEKVLFKGKEQWDDHKIMQFLEKCVETKINPKLYKSSASNIYKKPSDGLMPYTEYANPISDDELLSDLPF